MHMKQNHKSKTRRQIQQIVGWYGVLAILLAYILLTFKVVVADGLPYQLLNLTGSAGIATVALAHKDTQPVVLNVIWAAVALIGILRLFFA